MWIIGTHIVCTTTLRLHLHSVLPWFLFIIMFIALTPSARWRYCYRQGDSSACLRCWYPYRHDISVSFLHKHIAGVDYYCPWVLPRSICLQLHHFSGGLGEGYSLRQGSCHLMSSVPIDHYRWHMRDALISICFFLWLFLLLFYIVNIFVL